VHFVLCGSADAGSTPLSQAVLGGVALGDDDEGFSGYGPARYFTSAAVAELSRAMSGPEIESAAAARFDAERMSQLGIYPGWRASDVGEVIAAVRRLRDFYSDATEKRRAIVSCLVRQRSRLPLCSAALDSEPTAFCRFGTGGDP
jgi:hypothetical protein